MTDIIWTPSRLVVKALMEKLTEVRSVEKYLPNEIPYDFGNLADAVRSRAPRLIWKNRGGVILETVNAPSIQTVSSGGVPSTTLAVGYNRSNYVVRIWERDPALAEIILSELVTASRLMDRSDQVVVEKMPWDFITETEGKWLENGAAIIDATIGIRASAAKEPIGSTADVVVAGSEFRAGINTDGNLSDPNDAEFDVNRLTGAWPG